MGVCCIRKEDQAQFTFEESSLSIANGRSFPNLTLLFSQQRPSKLKAQCAMVFLTTAIDADDCKMFAQLRQSERKTLKESIQRLAEKKPFVVGQFLLAENPAPKLKVDYLLVVCLPVWKSAAANNQIDEAVGKAFSEVGRMKFKSLVVCQPNDSLGLPNNIGGKILLRNLNEMHSQLSRVTFLLSNEATQNYYHGLAGRFLEDKDLSSVRSDY